MSRGQRESSCSSSITSTTTVVRKRSHSFSTSIEKKNNQNNQTLDMKDWRKAVRTPISYTVSNDVVRLQTTFVSVVAILGTLVLFTMYTFLPTRSFPVHEHDHLHTALQCIPKRAYNYTYPLTAPEVHGSGSKIRYKIAVIADLDTESKSTNQSHLWRSYLLQGHLSHFADDEVVRVEWDGNIEEVHSSLSSGGRGMELSELAAFNGKLYSCDDRTGIVYEVIGNSKVVPWVILNDGDGKVSKGFKCEWMAVKDEKLYVGGFGKEWTTTTGQLVNFDPQWIKVIDIDGRVEHENWRKRFISLRSSVGIEFPGYMIHESGVWSPEHRRWFFLPRRASKSPYDEVEDERKGTNFLFSVSEDFSDIKVTTIGEINPTRGFSSFKFIPGTKDRLIVALKSMEDRGQVDTFVTVFDIDGRTILPEQSVNRPGVKFEGIEFV